MINEILSPEKLKEYAKEKLMSEFIAQINEVLAKGDHVRYEVQLTHNRFQNIFKDTFHKYMDAGWYVFVSIPGSGIGGVTYIIQRSNHNPDRFKYEVFTKSHNVF